MKRLLLLCICCFLFGFSNAQSLAPSVVGFSGSSFSNATSQLDWTAGETVTNTLSAGSNMLTQGFHQPNLTITAINEAATDYSVTVFPNPAVDLVHLQFNNTHNVTVELFSIQGKLLRSVNAENHLEIPMTEYKAGTYLLTIQDQSAKVKTYRIVKSQ